MENKDRLDIEETPFAKRMKKLQPTYIESHFSVPTEGLYKSIQDSQMSMEGEKKHKLFTDLSIDLNPNNDDYSILNNNTDLESITLVCDTLILNREVKLPGVHVNIYARHIEIGKNGCIDISAQPHIIPDDTQGDASLVDTGIDSGNGKTVYRKRSVMNGRKGGDFRIFCETFHCETTNGAHFVSNGGDGQELLKGNPGNHGAGIKKRFGTPRDLLNYLHGKGDMSSYNYNSLCVNVDNSHSKSGYDRIKKELSGFVGEIKFHTKLGAKSRVAYNDVSCTIDVKAEHGKNAVGDSRPSDGGHSGGLATNQDGLVQFFKNEPGKGQKTSERKGGKNGINKSMFSGGKNSLRRGESISKGESLVSLNGRYKLKLQKDGNLILHDFLSPDDVKWAAMTHNLGIETMRMDHNGRLVLLDKNNKIVRILCKAYLKTDLSDRVRVDGFVAKEISFYGYSINVYDQMRPCTEFILQDDRNIVLYDGNHAMWNSDTHVPNGSYHRLVFRMDETTKINARNNYFTYDQITTDNLEHPSDGYTFEPESGKSGGKGTIVTGNAACSWLHPALVEMMIRYTKDAYVLGHIGAATDAQGTDGVGTPMKFSEAKQNLMGLTSSYADVLNKLEYDASTNGFVYDKINWEDGYELWNQNYFVAIDSAKAQLNSMHHNLALGLDYYGNSRSYMPAPSLSVALDYYKKNLDSNIPVALVSAAILKKMKENTDYKTLLVKTIGNIQTNMDEAGIIIKKALEELDKCEEKLFGDKFEARNPIPDTAAENVDINDLDNAIKKYKPIEEKIQFLLKVMQKREQELYIKAKDNEEQLKMYKNVIKVGAVACRVIPVGQPALGIVGGTALDGTAAYLDYSNGKKVDWGKAVKFDRLGAYYKYHKSKKKMIKTHEKTREQISDGVTDLKSIYNDFKYEEKDGKATNVPSSVWYKSKTDDLRSMHNRLRSQEKDLNAANFSDAINGAQDLYKGWAVSESEVQAAYQKMRKNDDKLGKIADCLEKVNHKKSLLTFQLNKQHKILDDAFAMIREGECLLLYYSSENNAATAAFNDSVSNLILKQKRAAFDKLYYYHYLLNKSYEAYFLKPSTIELNTENFIDTLDDSLEQLNEGKMDTESIYSDLLKKTELIKKFFDTTIVVPSDLKNIPNKSSSNRSCQVKETLVGPTNKFLKDLLSPEVSSDYPSYKRINFDISELRGLTDSVKYSYNSRLTGFRLHSNDEGDSPSLKYSVVGADGQVYDIAQQNSQVLEDSDGRKFTYSLYGAHRIRIFTKGSGMVKKNDGEAVFLKPEAKFGFYWEYNFKSGSITPDNKPMTDDDTAKIMGGGENVYLDEELVALPPLDMEYVFQYEGNALDLTKTYSDNGEKVELKVVPQIKEFDLVVKYSFHNSDMADSSFQTAPDTLSEDVLA